MRIEALQLAEKVFCGSDFGFVGAPDFSPAIEVGLIPGFSPGALFQGIANIHAGIGELRRG